MAFKDSKHLSIRIAFDKVLRDKAFNIAKNSKYDGYQHGLASIFSKKSLMVLLKGKLLALELHKPIIKTFQKHKIYLTFMGNI